MRKSITNLILCFVLIVSICLCNIIPVEAGIFTKKNYLKIYNALLKHKTSVKFTIPGRLTDLTDIQNKMFSPAYNNKKLGDFAYLEGLIKSYGEGVYYSSSNKTECTLKFDYVYGSKKVSKLDKEIKNVVRNLGIDDKSDYDKVKYINNYIIDNVSYYKGSLDLTIKDFPCTAYGALINHEAVCEGYSLLFYRMCREAGIPLRFITGVGYDPVSNSTAAHAWNIVKINDKWYNIDVTWNDSGVSRELDNSYFLMNDEDFIYHKRDTFYTTAKFISKYQIASESLGYN